MYDVIAIPAWGTCVAADGIRRRKYASWLFATAMVASVGAFQNSLTPYSLRRKAVEGQRFPTAQRVVTDPEHLLRTNVSEKRLWDLEALEGAYRLTSSDYDEITIDMIETSSRSERSVSKASSSKQHRRQPTNAIQSSTKSPTKMGNQKITSIPNNTNTVKPIESMKTQTVPSNISRSSTMPGFVERSNSDRERAFRDGIKLAEQRSGKKLSQYVDTAEAKDKRRRLNGEAMYKTSASVPESMIQFANEIHNVERITPKEEVVLGEKTQEAMRLQKLYDKLQEKLKRTPTDQEWCAAAGKINMESIRQTIDEGVEAKNMLVTSNLRMVQGVVNVYIRNGLGGEYNAGDLMQEGIVALIRAAEKFDPNRGFRFSTYAMYWIRSAIKRQQIFQSRVITVPQRLYENHKRIMRVGGELQKTLGRPPTKQEIGVAVGMSELQVERCITAMAQRCHSLDQFMTNTKKPMSGDSQEDTMYEVVASRPDDGDYNSLQRLFLREDLIETLYRHLSEEEAKLLLLRYGLVDDSSQSLKTGGPLTIAEVSRLVGLKPDKVRRMLNHSLEQLKTIIGEEWAGCEYDRLQ